MAKKIAIDDLRYYLTTIEKTKTYINAIANKIIEILNKNEKKLYTRKWLIKPEKYTENSENIMFGTFCGVYLMYGTDESVYIGLNPKCTDKNFILAQEKVEQDVEKCFFAVDILSDRIQNKELIKQERRWLESKRGRGNWDLDYYYFGFENQQTVIDDAVRIIETYYNPPKN